MRHSVLLRSQGKLDAIIGNSNEYSDTKISGSKGINEIHKNNGDGTFSSVKGGTFTEGRGGNDWNGRNTMSIALADYDGDGDLDILTGNVGHENELHDNDGNGIFTRIEGVTNSISVGATGTQSVAWMDFDGDGNLDAITGDTTATGVISGKRLIHRNEGNGKFKIANSFSYKRTDEIHIADINGDGLPDIYFGGDSELYHNAGGGSYVSALGSSVTARITASEHALFLDFDGDGDLDVVVGGSPRGAPSHLELHRNDGGGAFTRMLDAGSITASNRFEQWMRMAVVDWNNDGYTDVFVGFLCCVDNHLHRNNGDGTFTNVATKGSLKRGSGGWGHTSDIAFGDYNNDGLIDAVTSGWSGYKLHKNEGDDVFSMINEADSGLEGLSSTATGLGRFAWGKH